VAAVAGDLTKLKASLRQESLVQVIRSDTELAADLLLTALRGPGIMNKDTRIFLCDGCQYVHVRLADCWTLLARDDGPKKPVCPCCEYESDLQRLQATTSTESLCFRLSNALFATAFRLNDLNDLLLYPAFEGKPHQVKGYAEFSGRLK
jgi:hypothetical protein